MALQRRNGRSRATLLFLVLTSVTVITLDFRGDGAGVIGRVRDVATDALAPVRDGAGGVLSPVSNVFRGITGYDDLEDENARLQAELAEERGRATREQSAESELEELLDLQDLSWVGDISQVSARVVSAPVSNFEQTIELDKGTDHGIDVDMPVVTGDGLVGLVVEASGKRAIVRLLTDPGSAVGIRVDRSGEAGIAEGEGADRALSVGFIEVTADVRERDLAVTSGLGSGIYPPGIPVGRLTEVDQVEGELQQRVQVEPLADIERLRFVKVLQVRQP